MSWADDIRCLYCDGKLPLYKKITNGQFCSSSHQKAYWHDQERLAIERLRESYPASHLNLPRAVAENVADRHTVPSGMSSRTASGAIVLQPVTQLEPGLRGLMGERWPRPVLAASEIIAAEPFPYEMSQSPSLGAARFWAPFFVYSGQLPKACAVKSVMPPPLWLGARVEAHEISPIIRTVSPIIRNVSPVIRNISPSTRTDTQVHRARPAHETVFDIPATRLLELPVAWLTPREPKRGLAGQIGPLALAMRPAFHRSTPISLQTPAVSLPFRPESLQTKPGSRPGSKQTRSVSPRPASQEITPAQIGPVERATRIEPSTQGSEAAIPHAEKLCALPRILGSSPFARPTPVQDEAMAMPMDLEMQRQLPANGIPQRVASCRLGVAKLALLPFPQGLAGTFHRASAEVSPLEAKCEAPQFRLATPARGPRLRPAAGSRYTVESRKSVPTFAPHEPAIVAPHIPGISLPERRTAASVSRQEDSHDIPAPAGVLPLSFTAESARPAAPAADVKGFAIAGRFDTVPRRPRLRLEPQDPKPASDWLRHSLNQPALNPPAGESPAADQPATDTANADQQAAKSVSQKSVDPPRTIYPWMHAVDFFRNAPRDLKLLAFAIPVLLSIALNPSAPKVKTTAPGGFPANIEKTLNAGFNDQWVTVRQTVLDRAAVALDEDFRSGLDNWMTRGDAATSWGFDATGFVRPGPLALYEPSVGLSDYQMQFLGVIDKKALSWVVRAADFDNYYVIKLMVLKPGPLPTIGVTRYAVIQGKAQDRVDTVLPITARSDMLYRVSLDVRGEDFALAVQGQMVDNWSEPRLKRGGVGFFTGRGEESRVRWVQVTHQYDMLGRLCAYLAPYNISTTDGGF